MVKCSSKLLLFIQILLMAVLVSCSTAPAPWNKRAQRSQPAPVPVQDQSAPVREQPMVVEEPVYRPEPVPEPVAQPEPEPAYIPEPMVAEAPEPIQSAGGGDILTLPTSYFAVQIYASKTERSMDKFVEKYDLFDLQVVRTDRKGEIVLVLVSIQPDRASAKETAADLQARTDTKPWVRSLAGLQKIVAQ